MTHYFEAGRGILRATGGEPASVLDAVASRYIGANPKLPHVFRVHPSHGVRMDRHGGYCFELERWYADAPVGSVVCAWAKVWSDKDAGLPLAVRCRGPLTVSVNGETAFRSWHQLETVHEIRSPFTAKLRRGWNHLVLTFERTLIGFGGVLGAAHPKWVPFHVLAPSLERDGQAGWILAGPFDDAGDAQALIARTAEAPEAAEGPLAESAIGWSWLPELEWPEAAGAAKAAAAGQPEAGAAPAGEAALERRPVGQLRRMYAEAAAGESAYGWTRWTAEASPVPAATHAAGFTLRGRFRGDAAVYVDGAEIGRIAAPDWMEAEFHFIAAAGPHDLLLRSECPAGGGEWGFTAELRNADGTPVAFCLPAPVQGAGDSAWLYAGPFPAGETLEPDRLTTLYRLPEWEGRAAYWRLDKPGQHIRVYAENPQYGKWSYPLGVTLYGLLEAGRTLGRTDLVRYVLDHMEACTSLYRYSLWDAQEYGMPSVNHLLATMDMLDDCGSQGSALLESMKDGMPAGAEEVVRAIGAYMRDQQERLPDGAFYRDPPDIPFNRDTLWADDLYMSTPFLVRYAARTRNKAYLDDAAHQFLKFRDYLFMPDRKIMSHVYFVRHGKANGIPWGRGNGWTVFSLSELLPALPEEHPARAELLQLFRDQCEGYLALQGKDGLWHNLLTDPGSFEESSCTAMFLYAFARGIRYGWLEEPRLYETAVRRAWEGLCGRAVDATGNLYGVCQGSGYSFSAQYYKNGLSAVTNDTHGVGIVLLAGVELIRLNRHLYGEGSDHADEQG
ncbi:glycoside hydrolase family 88/105 protein [Gorillibacterium sp. sgz5001074]|uniref:glycoside hydrolase family 88/105 protein n=1 Tax=Gorillibacterium sp. sgz5001074 TaxID=3446695 RepID=UPI003F66A86B